MGMLFGQELTGALAEAVRVLRARGTLLAAGRLGGETGENAVRGLIAAGHDAEARAARLEHELDEARRTIRALVQPVPAAEPATPMDWRTARWFGPVPAGVLVFAGPDGRDQTVTIPERPDSAPSDHEWGAFLRRSGDELQAAAACRTCTERTGELVAPQACALDPVRDNGTSLPLGVVTAAVQARPGATTNELKREVMAKLDGSARDAQDAVHAARRIGLVHTHPGPNRTLLHYPAASCPDCLGD